MTTRQQRCSTDICCISSRIPTRYCNCTTSSYICWCPTSYIYCSTIARCQTTSSTVYIYSATYASSSRGSTNNSYISSIVSTSSSSTANCNFPTSIRRSNSTSKINITTCTSCTCPSVDSNYSSCACPRS